MHAVAIGSALLSALSAAVGMVLRQKAIDDESARRNDGAPSLRQPSYWAGVAVAVVGFVFQAYALAHGSLLLVQPLLVSSLLFVLPLNAMLSRHRLRASDFRWALVLTAALAVFVVVGQPHEGQQRPAVPAWTVALACAVPVMIGCIVAARYVEGRPRAMLLAVSVSVLLGLVAVLTKVSTHGYAVSGWQGLLRSPAPYLLVALAVASMLVQQAAFRADALQASVPIMLVGEPVVAVLVGVVVLGEHVDVHGAAVAMLVVAAAAMTAATVALGRGPGARTEKPGQRQLIDATSGAA